ncbi:hypothetical protein PPROV_000693500 [Pycnococcus provasolii]|uniref:Uncharacterized protein n=1 Tax=Pycnococcus provasolii TaxID=41880 RepID=A0A830HLY9_9CHLO|nr:hypothetical protein PPROV_000693500 [Pycnococcus provasolii]|mmetsp:Transcript_2979/g.8124  ORF Transcript_2979/g.8124 Transcript_2979/m.8124 type:complete len:303 (+) Transcript_2979:64-972(+)
MMMRRSLSYVAFMGVVLCVTICCAIFVPSLVSAAPSASSSSSADHSTSAEQVSEMMKEIADLKAEIRTLKASKASSHGYACLSAVSAGASTVGTYATQSFSYASAKVLPTTWDAKRKDVTKQVTNAVSNAAASTVPHINAASEAANKFLHTTAAPAMGQAFKVCVDASKTTANFVAETYAKAAPATEKFLRENKHAKNAAEQVKRSQRELARAIDEFALQKEVKLPKTFARDASWALVTLPAIMSTLIFFTCMGRMMFGGSRRRANAGARKYAAPTSSSTTTSSRTTGTAAGARKRAVGNRS